MLKLLEADEFAEYRGPKSKQPVRKAAEKSICASLLCDPGRG